MVFTFSLALCIFSDPTAGAFQFLSLLFIGCLLRTLLVISFPVLCSFFCATSVAVGFVFAGVAGFLAAIGCVVLVAAPVAAVPVAMAAGVVADLLT